MSAPLPTGTMDAEDYARWLLGLRKGSPVTVVNAARQSVADYEVLSITMAHITVWGMKFDRRSGAAVESDHWLWPREWAIAQAAAQQRAREREKQEARLRESIRGRLGKLPLEALERIERIATAEGRL